MDWYALFKFLHILTAVAWVGGAFVFLIASEIAQRSPGPVYAGFSAVMAKLGGAVFVPASMLTLVFGIVLTVLGWSFVDLWIILALVGIAVSVGLGKVLIGPASDRVAELARIEGPDSPKVRAISAGILRIVRFDLVLMVVIIADMVFKPVPGDLLILSLMGAALALGALMFLTPRPVRTGVPA